jgi:iron complex transport system ATP-binding protein
MLRSMEPNEAPVEFTTVSFSYPSEDGLPVENVFSNLSLQIPSGMVSLVGQNGTGKSTFLLLAGGRLLPSEGRVSILGRDSREITGEEERNRYASFVYQNMEFDTDDPIGVLLEYVYVGGSHLDKSQGFYDTVIETFELSGSLKHRLQELSKGEIQRTVMAFSVLYGSRLVMMDEPVFALEHRQKERALDFFRSYARDTGRSVYFSLHELDLSRKYAQSSLLFFKDGTIKRGTAEETLTRENIEAAYGTPYDLLSHGEILFRERILEEDKILSAYKRQEN